MGSGYESVSRTRYKGDKSSRTLAVLRARHKLNGREVVRRQAERAAEAEKKVAEKAAAERAREKKGGWDHHHGAADHVEIRPTRRTREAEASLTTDHKKVAIGFRNLTPRSEISATLLYCLR